MDRITVGLDFGTHQTKVCIENKADVNNPVYSFFPFEDLDGNKTIILPSIIQINKDNTLSYGYVDKAKSQYGKKFFIGVTPKYPQKPIIPSMEILPFPPKPKVLLSPIPVDESELLLYRKAKLSYDTQITLWQQRKAAIEAKHKRQIAEMEVAYQNELKEWYRWQNTSQTNHRMIYRYFKQSTFSDYKWNCYMSSTYLSTWYLSYVIFKLEEAYGQNFAIQMGIPTGSDNFEQKKRRAVSLLLTAYHIVEDVFQNDLEKFLSTPVQELERLTTFVPYSKEKKQEYGLLIFPEAYAGLKSLTERRKIQPGMSLMVDIGGGTTDITFFTIENEKPTIYDYSSIPFGLNFIAETATPNVRDKFDVSDDLNSVPKEQLDAAVRQYYINLEKTCNVLLDKLQKSFERTGFPVHKLRNTLENRPLIYSGGGSTYSQLRKSVATFTDVKHINPRVWEGMTIDALDEYVSLCPVISTSLGLAISEVNDEIKILSINDIFKHMEGLYREDEKPRPKWV